MFLQTLPGRKWTRCVLYVLYHVVLNAQANVRIRLQVLLHELVLISVLLLYQVQFHFEPRNVVFAPFNLVKLVISLAAIALDLFAAV
jgi:hypothetical protein